MKIFKIIVLIIFWIGSMFITISYFSENNTKKIKDQKLENLESKKKDNISNYFNQKTSKHFKKMFNSNSVWLNSISATDIKIKK